MLPGGWVFTIGTQAFDEQASGDGVGTIALSLDGRPGNSRDVSMSSAWWSGYPRPAVVAAGRRPARPTAMLRPCSGSTNCWTDALTHPS